MVTTHGRATQPPSATLDRLAAIRPPRTLLRGLAHLPLFARYRLLRPIVGRLYERIGTDSLDARIEGLRTARDRLDPCADLHEIARRVQYEHEAHLALASALLLERGAIQPSDFLRIEGLEAAAEVLRGPTIVAGTHFGAYLALPLLLLDTVPMVYCVSLADRLPHLTAVGQHLGTVAWRARQLEHIEVPRADAMLRLIAALRRRRPVHVTIDTDIGSIGSRSPVPFLGTALHHVEGWGRVARRVPFGVVHGLVERVEDESGEHFEIQLRAWPAETVRRDPEAIFRKLLAHTESAIQRHPAQWALWKFHRAGLAFVEAGA